VAEMTTQENLEATILNLSPGCRTLEEAAWSRLLGLIQLAYMHKLHKICQDEYLLGVPEEQRTKCLWLPYNVPSLNDIEMGRSVERLVCQYEEVD
jgi:hypothetical protein